MMKGEQHNPNHNQNHFTSAPPNSTQQNAPSTPTFQTFQHYPHFTPHPFQTTETTLTTTTTTSRPKKNTTPTTSEDGPTIELSRRPRGRPPGSKNKPKPTLIITQPDPNPTMSPYILELPPKSNLTHSLTRFTQRRNVSIYVLNATGSVENVTLNQPSTSGSGGGTVTFHGVFEILSLSGCLMVGNAGGFTGFTISLSGPQGHIVGGRVVGPLVCCGTVFVVATSFCNPGFFRLPLDGADDGGGGRERSQGSEGDGNGGGGGGGGGGHVSLYGSSSDVMWDPTRQSQPNY